MIVIALGSNLSGKFGSPACALRKAIGKLAAAGIQIIDTSKMYKTEAYAYARQPDFFNAIATIGTALSAGSLLEVFKKIEAEAGRRNPKSGRPPQFSWLPRPLDLDIVSYKGVVCNWKSKRPKAGQRVILPHPRAHERAFVLRPLAEIAPDWHHPVFGLTAEQLLKRPGVREAGKIKSCQSFWGDGA